MTLPTDHIQLYWNNYCIIDFVLNYSNSCSMYNVHVIRPLFAIKFMLMMQEQLVLQ